MASTMPDPQQYTIYFANLNPTRGSEIDKTRPVVVISVGEMNRHLETVVVCPLTTSLHPSWRSRIQIKCADRDAEIAVDQIRTISKSHLGREVDRLSSEVASQLRRLITEMYGE